MPHTYGPFTIRVAGSGHSFEAVSDETLLEAALRSGLNIRHHCASGTCGECKGRLLEGTLGRIDFHDYVLSEAEKLQGHFLLCRAHAATDMLIEASEARTSADIPRQSVQTRLIKVERPADDYLVAQVRTPRTMTLRFLAGQSATVTVDGIAPHQLAIASCPCNGMYLDFHLSRAGEPQLFERLLGLAVKPQLPILIEGPSGEFTLDDDHRRPLLMVAAETGLAPVKSLIEHAINLEWMEPIHLYWIVEEGGSHYLDRHCRAWGEALDHFEFHPLVVADTNDVAGYQDHLVDLLTVVTADPRITAHLSLPSAAADQFAVLLARVGLTDDRLYRFEAATE